MLGQLSFVMMCQQFSITLAWHEKCLIHEQIIFLSVCGTGLDCQQLGALATDLKLAYGKRYNTPFGSRHHSYVSAVVVAKKQNPKNFLLCLWMSSECKKRFHLHFYTMPLSKTPFETKRRRLWLQAIKPTDWTDETCDIIKA